LVLGNRKQGEIQRLKLLAQRRCSTGQAHLRAQATHNSGIRRVIQQTVNIDWQSRIGLSRYLFSGECKELIPVFGQMDSPQRDAIFQISSDPALASVGVRATFTGRGAV
jgi:hypothetical protein